MNLIKEADAPASKARIASYLYFSSLYFVATGVLYLWGYWTPFGINILEYMSLADVLKATAFPIAITTVGMAAAILLTYILDSIERMNPFDRRGKISGIKRWTFRIAPPVVFAISVLLLVAIFPYALWATVPFVATVPLARGVLLLDKFKQLIPSPHLRLITAVILVAIPLGSLALGMISAAAIRDGAEFTYVVSEVPGTNVSENATLLQRLRFLGHAGDFIFLLDPTKDAIIFSKVESGKPLILKRHIPVKLRSPLESWPAARAGN